MRSESREAFFDNVARIVILKGDPKLWRGKDIVRGRKITYDLKTGWIKSDRVEGVVQSAQPAATPAPVQTPQPTVSPSSKEAVVQPTPTPALQGTPTANPPGKNQ